MESFIRDLKYSARQLVQAPAFTATAVLIVAIGIGANTAAFSVVNAMLFRPVPSRSSVRRSLSISTRIPTTAS